MERSISCPFGHNNFLLTGERLSVVARIALMLTSEERCVCSTVILKNAYG